MANKNNIKIADRSCTTAPLLSFKSEETSQAQRIIVVPVEEFNCYMTQVIEEIHNIGAARFGAGCTTMKEVMTPAEAAEVLGISVKHLMELRKAGKINCAEDGRLIRFHRDHILSYINNFSKTFNYEKKH